MVAVQQLALRSFFHACGEQLNHLGDACRALFGTSLRRIDVAQVGASVELCDRVEECGGG